MEKDIRYCYTCKRRFYIDYTAREVKYLRGRKPLNGDAFKGTKGEFKFPISCFQCSLYVKYVPFKCGVCKFVTPLDIDKLGKNPNSLKLEHTINCSSVKY